MKSNDIMSLFFQKSPNDSENFKSRPLPPGQKTDVICCCQKDLPHDESMKFILKAS